MIPDGRLACTGRATDREFGSFCRAGEIDTSPNIEVQLVWQVVEITKSGVQAINKKGQTRRFEVDAVVLATGVKPVTELFDQVGGVSAEVFKIGDCSRPGNIASALTDGRIMGGQI